MTDSLLIPRSLVQRLFNLAQTTAGDLQGVILANNGNYQLRTAPAPDSDMAFAQFGRLITFDAPLPNFTAPRFLGLSLNTKGVLELRAWQRQDDNRIQETPIHILT